MHPKQNMPIINRNVTMFVTHVVNYHFDQLLVSLELEFRITTSLIPSVLGVERM